MPKKSVSTDPLAGKKDDENVWVENLKTGESVYRSTRTNDPYPMTGNGLVGSVISIPLKVVKEAYFRRAVSRENVRLLTDDEASLRESELDLAPDEGASSTDRTMQALEKGASDVGSRFTKKGLSDDGTEGQAIPAGQVWKNRAAKSSTVRRSDIKAPAIPLDEVPDGPIPAIIEAPVKEGDPGWSSDTGE